MIPTSNLTTYPFVLILGCGRSGTSIFGELFEHLPHYTYYSEPSFESVVDLDFNQAIAVKVPKQSNGFDTTPGLSFPLSMLLQFTPKIYWQVRHPLDAIASLRVGIANNWGHHPRPPDWRQWLSRPLVQQCAHHWVYINSLGYNAVKDFAHVSRFEEMVIDPYQFTKNICADIGVNPQLCNNQLIEWSERVQNTNNEKFIEAKTSRAYSTKDHKTRIGRWRENLTVDEVNLVIPMIYPVAATFGYELDNL